ncbi:MAG: OsmC family protein [Candidatus Atabeyarchaeum deiterrae]
MMTVSLIENVKFEAECRGHKLTLDQPVEDGGSDAGMTPVELFVASLGSCIGYFAVVFCQRRKIPPAGMNVKLDWESAEDPHRIGSIDVVINLSARLGEKERAGLLRMVEGCTVHNTLKNKPNVKITLK